MRENFRGKSSAVLELDVGWISTMINFDALVFKLNAHVSDWYVWSNDASQMSKYTPSCDWKHIKGPCTDNRMNQGNSPCIAHWAWICTFIKSTEWFRMIHSTQPIPCLIPEERIYFSIQVYSSHRQYCVDLLTGSIGCSVFNYRV